jgi:hypothetical protein
MSSTAKSLGVVTVISALAFALSWNSPAAAQGRGRGRGQDKKAEKIEDKREGKDEKREQARENRQEAIDRAAHARAIREYARAGSLPPGLAKREQLPPGLRKQLRERGELPPGLDKRWQPVPAPLVTRLPPVPPYYQRYFAGDDLIIVDTRTNRIAAIIRDVWR